MQEFHNCLKAEGITSTLYKANGTLKEKFTYQVIDNNGKLHKKRSDKLGADHTRESIERTLVSNRHKRSLEAQKPIMTMSDWIEAQNLLQEELTMDRTELLLREEERLEKQRRINALNQQIESCRKRIKDYRDKLNNLANKRTLTLLMKQNKHVFGIYTFPNKIQ